MNISTKKDTTKDKNITISSLKDFKKTETRFLSSYKQKYEAAIKTFLSQEAGASGNNIQDELQKSRPKLKNCILNIYREYLLCL